MTQVTKNKSFMITFEGLGFRFKFEFPAELMIPIFGIIALILQNLFLK